jgi:polar amino acid transport system substrate-binding protein
MTPNPVEAAMKPHRLYTVFGLAVALAAFAPVPSFAQVADIKIPVQKVDPKLHAMLPADIQAAGELTAVNNGSFPPYTIAIDTHTLHGASADLAEALGQLLGIKIHHQSVSGFSAELAGIQSGRFQMSIGPAGDFPSREKTHDFIDFVQEYVVFAVHKGNPQHITSLADTCGKRIAVMAGGSAERVIKGQAELCAKQGKPALQVQSFTDQPTSVLAVRSNRSDAFFSSQAPLTYFAQQSKGQLELAGVGKANGFDDLYQGSIVAKGSKLGDAVLAGYQELFANGTYAAIMKKWGLEANMLKAPGLNLGGKAKK